jgi:hypothetical protein
MGYGSESGPPLPEAITPSIVETRARPVRLQIFENYGMLRAIIARHEAPINKRWLKKTSEQRRKIILPAWSPDAMSTTHRPDFAAFYKRDPQQSRQETDHNSAYMWPYINQEDLAKPRTLLLPMHSRAERPPAEFAAADFQATRLGRVPDALDNPFLNEYIMIFTGRHDASSYGELKHWNDHENGFEMMVSQKAPQPGIGLMILQI